MSFIAGLQNFELGKKTKYVDPGAISLQKIHERNKKLIDEQYRFQKDLVWSTDGSIELALAQYNGEKIKTPQVRKTFAEQLLQESFGSSHLSSTNEESILVESFGSSHLSQSEQSN